MKSLSRKPSAALCRRLWSECHLLALKDFHNHYTGCWHVAGRPGAVTQRLKAQHEVSMSGIQQSGEHYPCYWLSVQGQGVFLANRRRCVSVPVCVCTPVTGKSTCMGIAELKEKKQAP